MAKSSMPAIGIRLGAAALIAGTALCASLPAVAEEWGDTSIGYKYGTKFREPFNATDITKNIFYYSHVGGYKYGTQAFNVNFLMSSGDDAGSGTAQGAQEAYALYRNTLEMGKISGSPFKAGFVKDAGLTFGFDWNTKNNGYSSRKRMVVLGPTLMMDVPGMLNISLFATKESNAPNNIANSAAAANTRTTYKTYPMLDILWNFPLGDTPFNFQGFFDWLGSKGNDESGRGTKQEILTEFAVMLDAGKVMGGPKNTFKVGIEYQYWRNKFGNDNGNPIFNGGATAKVPMLRAEYHF